MHVRPGELTPPLQDLGVLAVALEQPLAQPQRFEPANRVSELLVSLVGQSALVGDPAQQHVSLGDGRTLLEAFGELEGLAPKLLRSLEVALAHRQLAQAEQHQAAAASQVAVIAQLERAVQMKPRLRELTPDHEDQGEVVLAFGEHVAIANHFEHRERALRVARRRFPVAGAPVVRSDCTVEAGQPLQIGHCAAHGDRLLIGGDGPLMVVTGKVRRGEDLQQAGLGRRRDRLEGAQDGKRHLGQVHGVTRLGAGGEHSLGSDALGEHRAVVYSLEVSSGLGEQRGGAFRLR